MLKPNTQKYKLLEMIGISGEFPASQLPRLFDTPAYTEKMITDLKANHLIRCHYKDGLRGYRLTKHAKEMLLAYNPTRFHCYLDGNASVGNSVLLTSAKIPPKYIPAVKHRMPIPNTALFLLILPPQF